MISLKNDKVPFGSEINFDFEDITFVGHFKGHPDSVGLLIAVNNENIYNAVNVYLKYGAFSNIKRDNRLVFKNLNIIPNNKTRYVEFLTVAEDMPIEFTTGFKVFKSSYVDAVILYSIIIADKNFSIINFRELIMKLEMNNSGFTIDSVQKFLSLAQ